jgi:hypothetical protein
MNKTSQITLLFLTIFLFACKKELKQEFETPQEIENINDKKFYKRYENSYKNNKTEEQFQSSIRYWELEKIRITNYNDSSYISNFKKGDIYKFDEKVIYNSKGDSIGHRRSRLEGYFSIKNLHKSKTLDLDTLASEYFTFRMDKERITMSSFVKYYFTKTDKIKSYSITLYFKSVNGKSD